MDFKETRRLWRVTIAFYQKKALTILSWHTFIREPLQADTRNPGDGNLFSTLLFKTVAHVCCGTGSIACSDELISSFTSRSPMEGSRFFPRPGRMPWAAAHSASITPQLHPRASWGPQGSLSTARGLQEAWAQHGARQRPQALSPARGAPL